MRGVLFFALLAKCCLVEATKSTAAVVLICSKDFDYCAKMKKMMKKIQLKAPSDTLLCSISKVKWNTFLQQKLNREIPYFALFRKGKLIDLVTFNVTEKAVMSTLNSLRDPPVIVYNKTIDPSKLDKNKMVISLSSNQVYEPFYTAAFKFRNSFLTFIHQPGDNISIKFYNRVKNKTITFNKNEQQLMSWIKTCSQAIPPFPYIPKNISAFIAIVKSGESDEINDLFGNLDKNIQEPVVFGYANWKRDYSKIANCRLKPNSVSFVLINEDCYPFLDDDVMTPELIKEFIIKTIKKSKQNEKNKKESISYYDSESGVYTINSTMFMNLIPGNNCKFVHLSNKQSLSNNISYDNFKKASYYFSKANQKYMNFYQFDYSSNWVPPYLPNPDGFPMIVLYYPNNTRPTIYRNLHKKTNIQNWFINVTSNNICGNKK